jgi:glycosyltransferase involved in cell wall biosynthesis
VVTLDDDLQNPPEEIPKLIAKMEEGYDAVIGELSAKQDTATKKIGSAFIRYLNYRIFNKPKDIRLSSFRVMTRAVAEEMRRLKTPYPYVTGMLLTLTRNIANVPVAHHPRRYGRSNYNLRRLVKLAFNLIINYTSLPLRLLAFSGLLVSLFSFLIGLYFFVKKLLVKDVIPGWTSLVVLLSFFNGILMAVLAVMGEYLVRIIAEISNTPQFVIRQKHL